MHFICSELKQKYSVTGIPTLIVVSQSGQLISRGGRAEVTEQGPRIFQNWLSTLK